jgi:hypothetical protein
MQFPARRVVARLLTVFALGLMTISPMTTESRAVSLSVSKLPAANPADAQAVYRPEVRLRKLHLVRPDLILYPIAYEVYC